MALARLTSGDAASAATNALHIEISVIHAVHGDGGASVDPRLRDLPQLTKEQPFVRYNAFRLLDRRLLPLERGKPASYVLIDGRNLKVTLTDLTGQNGEERYHVRAEIAGPGKTQFLKLLEVTAVKDEPFFVGGQSYDGGTLFLELVVRP